MPRIVVGKERHIRNAKRMRLAPRWTDGPVYPPRREGSAATNHDLMAMAAELGSKFPRKPVIPKVATARQQLGIPDGHLAVLSLDGGGVRGLIPLAVLTRFEEKYDIACSDLFDVIVGTSTGAIIGSLIAAGFRAGRIRELYESEIHKIFNLNRNGTQQAYAKTYLLDLTAAADKYAKFLSALGVKGQVRTRAANEIKQWCKDNGKKLATVLPLVQRDRMLRVMGGSPVYNAKYLRDLLNTTFTQQACASLGGLSRKKGCILVFTAVDSTTGSTVYMSATGSNEYQGSCEGANTANCVSASMSAPLYFSPFRELMDGGTLFSNMPLLGALLHIEELSRRWISGAQGRASVEAIADSRLAGTSLANARALFDSAEDVIVQPFDLHATTIFSMGTGVAPLKPLEECLLDVRKGAVHYHQKKYPYGELSRALQIADLWPSAPSFPTSQYHPLPVIAELVWGIDAAMFLVDVVSTAQRSKEFVDNMAETVRKQARFGLGRSVNTLAFMRDGISRDTWAIQEDVFRSGFYAGQFRRFQLSLDRETQQGLLWRYNANYNRSQGVNAAKEDYKIPFRITLDGKVLLDHSYDVFTMPDAVGDPSFIPGLEPLGTLSLRWLWCIGERFADAIEEYCQAHGVPFMAADVVDRFGEDAFVSEAATNRVQPQRWATIRDSLRKP